jgi:hypothetical protein
MGVPADLQRRGRRFEPVTAHEGNAWSSAIERERRLESGPRRPRTGRASSASRFLPQPLHAFGDLVIPMWEQMSVGPERHAQIGVTELPLHHKWIRALGDHHRYTAVAKRMRGEMVKTRPGHGRIPISFAEVAVADDLPVRRGEDELTRRCRAQMLGEQLHKEGRKRETPATAGGLQLICVGPVMSEPLERAHDEESLTAQVWARCLDAGEFAPAKSKVGPP